MAIEAKLGIEIQPTVTPKPTGIVVLDKNDKCRPIIAHVSIEDFEETYIKLQEMKAAHVKRYGDRK